MLQSRAVKNRHRPFKTVASTPTVRFKCPTAILTGRADFIVKH
jgi:hypothetical protein